MQAIKADRVFDGERLLPDGSVVLVHDHRFEAVQSSATALPLGCEVVDFPEATVMPGLIDAHVHLCCDSSPGALDRIPDFSDEEMNAVIETSLRRQLASGVTAVRDLGDRRYAVIEWRASRGDPALPTVVGSGPPITIPNGHCANMGGEAAGVAALRKAVRERAERGVDVVKVMASGGMNTPGSEANMPQFSTEEIEAVVVAAHAAGLTVTAHAHALNAIRSALRAGVDGIEHCTLITETGVEVPDDVVAALVESGTAVCPTIGFAPGAVLPPGVLEAMRKTGISPGDRVRHVAQLHDAGVRIIGGSDAGINQGKHHGVLPESLIQLVGGGISAVDVIASATSIGADACGLSDRKGRIAPGQDADMLLVRGDPFADITAMREVEAVYLRGERVV